MNKVFLKWYEELGENYVKDVFKNFEIIEKEFYEDRNKEDVVDVYLLYEKYIRDRHNRIKELSTEIDRFKRMKKDLMNYVINKLRDERKLINFLKNKDRTTLGKLRDVVDIEREYNEVDRLKFEEEKRMRGQNITMNLNN